MNFFFLKKVEDSLKQKERKVGEIVDNCLLRER